jgi:glutaredoxin-related protein
MSNTGLLYLSNDDFRISETPEGKFLVHSIPGFSLVLFYSKQCPHCDDFLPVFKKLTGSIEGCFVGILNVSTNKQCVMASRDTQAPIEYVPFVLLYYNGKPSMIYKGPADPGTIIQFIMDVSKQIQSNTVEQASSSARKIPEYTIGKPLFGEDNVCYLPYDDAYVAKKK